MSWTIAPVRVDRQRLLIRALALAAVVVTAAAACGSGSDPGTGAPPTSPSVTSEPTMTTAPPSSATTSPPPDTDPPTDGSVVWGDPTRIVDLGDGWTMAACEGDGPLLCVSHVGGAAGIVEGARFPIESFDWFDPAADRLQNLGFLATDFIEWVRSDRATGCPPGYAVEAFEPATFALGGTEALSYGYVGTNGDGSPSELNLQYATIDGEDIVLVTAIADDEGGCPGPDELLTLDSETLAVIRPRLEVALQAIPLPPPRR